MRRCLTLLLILIATTARAADTPKPNTLTPKEIADGWILLFDGETTFGWKVSGDVKVANGVLTLGGEQRFGSIETTGSFGRGEVRLSFKSSGGRFPTIGWRGEEQSFGRGAGWSELTWEPASTMSPLSPIRVYAPAGSTLELRSITWKSKALESIFNGKDLSGWKRYTGDEKRAKSKFTVTPEGWLNVKDGPGDLQTEGQWADFIFQGECISNGPHLNSGIFFRCLPGQYQQGYEMQIRNQWQGDDRTKPVDYGTGAIYRRQPARKVVSSDHEWFTMTLIAHGNHFRTWVNGYPVVDWTDTRKESNNAREGLKLGPGPLSIQGHDPTTDLSFRNLHVAELKKN
jgi:hypothetical protein